VGATAAAGSLVLRNPEEEPVTIDAGSTIETFEGDTYVFPAEITVPAASDGNPGEVVADIAAATPGPSGNRDTGMLSGRLSNGVYYSNRATPVAGGADVTRTVVTQEDLDGLQARAEETLRSLAATSVLSGNRRVVPSTLTVQDFAADYSATAGTETDSVSIEATIMFDALAFSTEGLNSAAAQTLSAQTPPGFTFLPETIVYQVPVETGEQNGTIAMISQVDGHSRAAMSDDDIDALVSSITGDSEDDAIATLQANEAVTTVDIDFSPSWLPHRIPRSADQIEVILSQ